MCAHVWVGGGCVCVGVREGAARPASAESWGVSQARRCPAPRLASPRLPVSRPRYLVAACLAGWQAEEATGGGGYEHTAQAVRKCWCTRVGTHVLMLSGAAARQKVAGTRRSTPHAAPLPPCALARDRQACYSDARRLSSLSYPFPLLSSPFYPFPCRAAARPRNMPPCFSLSSAARDDAPES